MTQVEKDSGFLNIPVSDTRTRKQRPVRIKKTATLDELAIAIACQFKQRPDEISTFSGGRKLHGSQTIEQLQVELFSVIQLIHHTSQEDATSTRVDPNLEDDPSLYHNFSYGMECPTTESYKLIGILS